MEVVLADRNIKGTGESHLRGRPGLVDFFFQLTGFFFFAIAALLFASRAVAAELALRGLLMGPLDFDVYLVRKALESSTTNDVSTYSPALYPFKLSLFPPSSS